MSEFEEQLKELRRRAERKRRLTTMLQELYEQQRELRDRVALLERSMQKEQADVDRLEGGSLAAFFYGVVGRKEDRLSKEREEAYAARVKYDAAVRELEALERDIRSYEDEQSRLPDEDEILQRLLEQQAEEVRRSGGTRASELLELEKRLSMLENELRELEEALEAGQDALDTAEDALHCLGSAQGMAVWDMVGGGFLSDMMKYSRLDTAQAAVEELQLRLQRFRTELADVTIERNLQVGVDGFMRFADYFFDNLFTDWMVMDHISRSRDRICRVRDQICSVLDLLDRRREEAEQERGRCLERREQLIRG